MKTTKSLFYGLLLVTGLVACSKEYNSNPAGNANAFGGSNPVAPITGASSGEIVFKENGATVRLNNVKWMQATETRRVIYGVVAGGSAGTITTYSIDFLIYDTTVSNYGGKGKFSDSLVITKTVSDASNPQLATSKFYTSGGQSKDLNGYCYSKVKSTDGDKMEGEFAGRMIRFDITQPDKDFGEFLDITSGFYNAPKFVP